MGNIRYFITRLRVFARRRRLDEELVEEIALHVELRRQDLIARGTDPRDAAYEARRRFGNVTAIREESRAMWGFPSIETLAQDARYGLRLLRRSRAFTVFAVLSLGIGMGASAAVFSLADRILFEKLPVRNPDELVIFRWISGPVFPFDSLSGRSSQTDTETTSTSFSLEAFEAAREQGAAHADVIGFAEMDRVTIGTGPQAELATGQAVSGNYFDVLGVPPAAGRPLTDQDDSASAPAVAMLSYAAWQRRFGGSPDAIGRSLNINSIPATIVGVAPRGFRGTLQVGDAPVVFVPLAQQGRFERSDDYVNPNFWWVLLAARLKAGSTMDAAQATFSGILRRNVAANRPSLAAADLPRIRLEPGARGQVEARNGTREPLAIMSAVVAVVLLVACANIANLLLSRASARTREIAVRVAIGAPRQRIVRQLLTESIVVAFLAAAAGLVVATWLARGLLPALDELNEGLASDIALDGRAVAFTMAVALGSSLVFGLFPALRGTDPHPGAALREAGRGRFGQSRRMSANGVIVAAQIALSLLLVAAAGLLVGSVRNLERIDPGFDPASVLLFRVDPTLNGYEGERLRTLYTSLLERVRALPGVVSASASSHTLIASSAAISGMYLSGAGAGGNEAGSGASSGRPPLAWRLTVDDRFFQTMRIPLLKGRTFSPLEPPTGQPVAIVNETFARTFLDAQEPIGRRFRLSGRPGAPEIEVVGVVADARYASLHDEAPPTAYLSYLQHPPGAMTFEVRTAGDPLDLVSAVRSATSALEPNAPLFDVRTQSMQIRHSLRRESLFARLATMLGAIALLLSAIGVYGMMAASVTRRTAEIGIRVALGAERGTITWMVLRQSLNMVGAGLAVGIPAALWSTQIVESLLFGLTPSDPRVLASAAAVLATIATVAAYVPARRAAHVDPLVALRHE
ncbi:MAG TPA: ABC transporter permease [Vicinamibacterales bacterium]|nr:ABC transporter permease [Vicinamibacterales bacterium]